MFNGGRLETPLGYVNATAAAFFVGTTLSIALAARRELPAVVRGLLLAGATAGLFVSVLAESRGWLFALPIVLAVAVALIPGRLRLALWTLPVAVLGAAALRPLLDVFERRDEAGLESPEAARQALIDAAAHAGSVALPLVAVALAVGVGLALLDRRVAVPAQVSRRAGRAAAALTALALVGGVVVGFAATDGRPDRKIADYWDRSQGYEQAEVGSSRFGSVGSNRPDFWKVSLSAFADRPIGGLGQDNWGDYYLRERDSTEQPRWTHSLQLRLLAHTGAVGFLLIAAFLAAVVAAALRGRGGRGRSPVASPSPLAQALAAIALLPLVVWFVHGSIDWFWEVPALSGSAFAFAGLATALSRGPAPARASVVAGGTRPSETSPVGPPSEASPAGAPPAAEGAAVPPAPGARPAAAARQSWRPLLAVAAGGVGLLAALALALPWLAERDTIAAAQSWHEDPAGALSRLNRAADLNPLSARADLTAGVIALELNGPELARLRFDRAIERDPDDWFGHFGRGLAESALGDAAAARADYVEARRLSPHDPLVREALRRVDGRRPLSAATAFARLREHVDELTG
nr:O-antigen ligase family protein [Conexibacter arvalis]